MEIKGKRVYTLGKLTPLELLVVQRALFEFFDDKLDTVPGETALFLHNAIADYRESSK
jgi:hypothetical protein